MSMTLPGIESLSGLMAFVVTVEAGGFAAASRRLGISASAVGKAVARLERKVEVRLLVRTTRQVMMTFEGEQLYARAARLLDDLRDIEGMLATQRAAPVGRVRASLPATLGRMVILPGLARFVADFPGIELDIGLDDRKVDLVEGGYDLAIRTGRLEDSGLIARKLAPHRFVLCASPDYLAAHGAPASLEELSGHTCIRFRYPSTGLLEKWAFDGKEWDRELPSGPVFNDGEAVVLAALGGLGLAQIPDYAAFQALRSGRLIPILTRYACIRGDLWLVRPVNRANLPRVEAFAQFLDDVVATSFQDYACGNAGSK